MDTDEDRQSEESLRLSGSEDGFGPDIRVRDFSLTNSSKSRAGQQCASNSESLFTLPKHSNQDFANQLLCSNRGFQNPMLLQPWEKGIMGQVFGKSESVVPFAKLVQPLPVTVSAAIPNPLPDCSAVANIPFVKRPLVPFLLKKLRSVETPYSGDPKALRALNRWRMIIELDLLKSAVGRQITEYVEAGNCEALIIETLEDALGTKSVATSLKRSSSILNYIWWARDTTRGNVSDPLKFCEKDCYDYVKNLRDNESSASKGKTFLQSLNFVRFQLGMEQAAEAVASSRIKGAASKMYRMKRPLDQAPPYSVEQVLVLHHIVSRAPDKRDRCKAGYDLFNMYASCRHDDAMNPAKWILDVDESGFGFLELHTNKHKVANTDERRSVFLPLVAVTPGIYTDSSWVNDWIEARDACGLSFVDKPTMPAPDSHGGWTDRPLGTGESAEWTRELLVAYGNKNILNKVRPRTHTGKATVLSWACKYGIRKDVRRILGHHIERGDSSVITYSRAALDVPLQHIVRMFRDIVLHKFDPDSSRLARLKMSQTIVEHRNNVVREKEREARPLEPQTETIVETKGNREVHEADLSDGTEPGFEFCELQSREVIANDSLIANSDPYQMPDNSDKSSNESEVGIDSASDDSSSESEDSSIDERAAREICIGITDTERPFVDQFGQPLETIQHNKSGVLHCRQNLMQLACKRRITSGFTIVKNLKCKWPVCTQCRAKCPVVVALKPMPKAKPSSE